MSKNTISIEKVDEKYLVDSYYPTIGIECHVQLKTRSKLFGTESNEAIGAKPNTLLGHITFGLPGALPVLNAQAVKLSVKAAFALGTSPQKFSKFDRKHYFYPDLPKGYQITQFAEPIVVGGQLDVTLEDQSTKTINITRAHIEEDAGKSTHPAGKDYSLVDLNRAGTPLLEIVSEPDMHNAEEAKAFAKELWLRMKYAGVSDVDLYHGNMRFDVNVSVSKDPSILGTRSETKNLNSFKSVERAVDHEIKRQIDLLEKGSEVVQETRGWLDDKQKTVPQRSKEDSHDYRYFPDPDLPPLVLSDEYIAKVKLNMPTMPEEWRERLSSAGIGRRDCESLLESQVEFDSDFLRLIVEAGDNAKVFANWVTNIEVPLRRELGEKTTDLIIDYSVRKQVFKEVNKLVSSDKISSNSARSLIIELLSSNNCPQDLEAHAEKSGYIQMSDDSALKDIVTQVLKDNPKAVEEAKSGELKVIGFLVGQVMKESKGKANPGLAQKVIKEMLGL